MRIPTHALVLPLLLVALPTAALAQTPELTARVTSSPVGLAPGASGTVDIVLENTGTATAGLSTQRLWLSVDTTLDAADLPLGAASVTATAGDTPQRIGVAVPTSVPAGVFSLLLEVDADGAFAEADETDNLVVVGDFLTAENFVVDGVQVSPSSAELGDTVRVQAQPRNLGLPVTGNVTFGVYLSVDAAYDPGDQPIHRGVAFFPGTADGVAIDVSFPLRTLPGAAPLQPGAFQLIVRLDDDEGVVEADETDNAAAAATRLNVLGADLRPLDIVVPDIAFMGRTMQISAEVENQGVADANGFTYSYFLSENDFVGVSDQRIFTSAPIDLPAGQSQRFEDTVDVPVRTSTACLWVGVIVNDRNQVAETSLSNNSRRRLTCVRLSFPIPDLSIQIIDTPTVAAAGEEFAVTRLLLNTGTADAANVPYSWYLSSDPTISPQDFLLGGSSATVLEGGDDYDIDVLAVPSTLAAGTYFIGALVDPDNVVEEVDDTNNAAAAGPIPVFSAAIAIGTNALPDATVGVPYDVGLFARRAPQPVVWSVAQGGLPPGLSLDGPSGILSGTPTEDGLFDVVLRASAGTAFADKPFSLRVLTPTVPLRIASGVLPGAIAGRAYGTRLVGVGGQPPYTWAPISDLPPGLELSEDGRLSGTPATPGALRITVGIRDSVEATASKELVLNVVNADQTLQIVQIPVPDGRIGVDYCMPEAIRLEARNGTPPLSWTVVGDAPPGLALSLDGELCGTPMEAGTFPLLVRVQDSAGLFDTSLFLVEVARQDALAITSFDLGRGRVNEPYEAQLSAIRGTEPYAWAVAAPSELPDGLVLEADGRIRGTPTTSGRTAFIVQVTDAVGRLDVQPLSIDVEAEPVVMPDPGEGCDSTGGAPLATWALLGVVLWGWRRRR